MPTERETDIILESEFEFRTFKEEPMNTSAPTQLPDEVKEIIKIQAKEYAAGVTFNSAWAASSQVSEFRINAAEDWDAGATEYATKLHQAQQEKEEERQLRVHLEKENDILTDNYNRLQQEIESLTNQLKKQNEVQDENLKLLRAENESLQRWKEEAKQLLNPIWDFADKNLGVPLGECKVKSVMKYIENSDTVLALYKQADKTNSDLIENAVTLLEKFISRHEAGLLPDRFIYNEIKQYLDGTK